MTEDEQRIMHEQLAKGIGRSLKERLPEGTGFAVVIFGLGGPGNMSYVANGVRGDMATMFRELADKLDAGPPRPFTKEGKGLVMRRGVVLFTLVLGGCDGTEFSSVSVGASGNGGDSSIAGGHAGRCFGCPLGNVGNGAMGGAKAGGSAGEGGSGNVGGASQGIGGSHAGNAGNSGASGSVTSGGSSGASSGGDGGMGNGQSSGGQSTSGGNAGAAVDSKGGMGGNGNGGSGTSGSGAWSGTNAGGNGGGTSGASGAGGQVSGSCTPQSGSCEGNGYPWLCTGGAMPPAAAMCAPIGPGSPEWCCQLLHAIRESETHGKANLWHPHDSVCSHRALRLEQVA